MSFKRKIGVSSVVASMLLSNLAMVANSASAQQPDSKHRPHGAQSARPAPLARPSSPHVRLVAPQARPSALSAPRISRQPHTMPHWVRPAPRHFAPPPVRYVAPAPRRHHDGPRRGWGWRPWGYGAAAAGAIIVGSGLVRSRPSDAEACANDFESFDWDSGTIINSDGDRELCPYLE
ncbi:MAG: hypothetical protein ABL904_08805 [Hyphomicrobiaceae bacterium]